MSIKQPHNGVFDTSNGDFVLEWNPDWGRITEEKLDTVQKVIDSEVLRYMKPYTPFRNGFLEKSAVLGTIIGSGEIKQIAPYARYLYYGQVYGPNIPIFEGKHLVGFFSPPGQAKHPTGVEMEYDTTHHPLAGKMWFERMKADHKDDILQAAAKSIGADTE